jgi:copper(I)-binding protein
MRRLLPLLLALPLVAAAPAPRLAVEQAQIRASQGGLNTTAAYFTVRNAGRAADVLTGAACDCAATAAVHDSRMAGGVSRMGPAGPLTIAPGGQLTLKPGGLHLMLTGLKRPIKAGETVRITLVFAKAGALRIPFKASDVAGMPGMDHTNMGMAH